MLFEIHMQQAVLFLIVLIVQPLYFYLFCSMFRFVSFGFAMLLLYYLLIFSSSALCSLITSVYCFDFK